MKNNKNIKIQHFENNTQTTCVVSSLRGVAVFAFRNAEWRLISYTNPTIGGVTTGEHIVHVHAYNHFLQWADLGHLCGVAHTEVGYAEAGK